MHGFNGGKDLAALFEHRMKARIKLTLMLLCAGLPPVISHPVVDEQFILELLLRFPKRDIRPRSKGVPLLSGE